MRDIREVPLQMVGLGSIQIPGTTSTAVCIPFDCELARISYQLTLAAEDALSFDIEIDTVDSLIDFQIPNGDLQGVGELTGKVFIAAGQILQLNSNGEQTTATQADWCLVIKPT